MQYPVEALLQWLYLTVQHIEAVKDLLRSLKTPISVTVLDPPRTKLGTRQASLDDLLHNVYDDRSVRDDVKQELREVAQFKIDYAMTEEKDAWMRLTEGQWDKWENSFNGKYHYEALMTSLRNLDLEKIGEFIRKGKMPEFKRLSDRLKVLPHSRDRPTISH